MMMKGNFLILLFSISICSISYGQVYVNPNAPPPPKEIQPTAALSGDGYLTQTVYGFLDFTTTIGNTVMVFSPQSAPSPEPPKSDPKIAVNVIETKPHVLEEKQKEIQPTKAVSKANKPKLSSVVQVLDGPQAPIENTTPKIAILASKVNVITDEQKSAISVLPEKKQIHSKIEIKEQSPIVIKPVSTKSNEVTKVINKPVFSSIVEVRSNDDPEPVLQVGNNLAEPEYDFLSRQPSEFAEETYKVINLKPTRSKSSNRHRTNHDSKRTHTVAPKDAHPTGLVTKLSGTVVKDGVTTVHETSVIGTYISGKYAQVLQSASHIYKNNKPKISPSSTLRILKTAAPTAPIARHYIDPTPLTGSGDIGPIPGDTHGSSGPNHVRASRRPATASGSFKNRFRNRNNKDEVEVEQRDQTPSTPNGSGSHSHHGTTKKSRHRSKSKNRRHKSSRNGSSKSATTTAPPSTEGYSRRTFKPKLLPSAVQAQSEPEQSSSLYKFKLNRAPGRWQYKTSPKPRVTIRKTNADEVAPPTPPTPNADVISNDIPVASSRSDDDDLESSGSINGDVLNDAETGDNGIENKFLTETLNVEISTPADFNNIYYEIATIKTPYTFQVGTVKNTRYITVTTTFEKSFEPEPTATASLTEPLTENILAPSTHIDKENNLLDSSIATLPPLYLQSDSETPPLETLTETFSTTQEMLKTHILPIIRDGANASSLTLIQTYHITRLVTATKTLPPMEAYQFVPSKRLKEFNSKLDEAGSELHLELDFGDDDNDEDDPPPRQLPPELDLANIGTDFDLFDVDRAKLNDGSARPKPKAPKVVTELPPTSPNLSPDQLQQLALLRLLNPGAAQVPQIVTTSKPVIKLETVYESHVIPIFNGQSTTYSTISRPVGTISKTEFEFGTSTLAALPIPQVPLNPFQQPQQQQQFQITTAPIVHQTVVTETQSKVLKLTFGAKTAYTTLFSTNVVPTMLTTYVTTSIPVQQTAAFPGFYPPPYAPYPFVG